VVFYIETDWGWGTHISNESDDGIIVGSFSLRATENAKFVIRNC
jgi:hypothetical protein